MNLDADRISLAHVHAYVDAQLSDSDCERLEDFFDVNPTKFEQLQQFLAINDHYQSIYDSVLKEPIPRSMLERILGGSHDPFQPSDGGFHQVSQMFSSLLFETLGVHAAGLSRRLVSLLQINRLTDNAWFARLKTMIYTENGLQDSAVARFFKALKLHPQTAPDWMNQLARDTVALLTKIANAFRDVTLFAVASIVTIGIVLGMNLYSSVEPDVSDSQKRGYVESQAIQAHLFYRKEGQSVLEIEKDKQHQLLTWLSGRLGKEIRLIDFNEMGYSNAGMTLVPALDNFALVTVYEDDQGQKLTLYVGLRDADKTDDIACASRESSKSLCSWANDTLQFVVVSDLAVVETRQLAEWMMQNYTMAHLISSNEYFFSQTLGTTNA